MLGIDISYGGSWYWVMVMNLLNWILIVLMIDFVNVVYVYVTYGVFLCCWIFGGGVGYVFEFCNGGVMWCDISVNLFDVLVNDLVIWCGWLVVCVEGLLVELDVVCCIVVFEGVVVVGVVVLFMFFVNVELEVFEVVFLDVLLGVDVVVVYE